jgi:protein-S-isoprenylcysteine O-methyltransferase Ste14
MQLPETIFVGLLFLLYLLLWRIKQVNQKKRSGIDPKVMAHSASNVQKYMNQIMNALTGYAILVVILHSAQIQAGSLFSRIRALEYLAVDITGFTIGLLGLSFCLYAQVKMGSSWRVGIDEKVKTDLITTGLYRYIRNPTYLGLFILNLGVWLIWPTWTVFLLNLIFVLFLEIQVRCEEDYLLKAHGQKYADYKQATKRYIPFIY